MKARLGFMICVGVVLIGSAPLSALSKGGGGVEYYSSIAPQALTGIGLPTAGLIDLPVGSIFGFGGFGYAVDRSGWKFGGFGRALFTRELALNIPGTTWQLHRAVGGLGGMISGGHGRIGPIDLSINARLGVAGFAVVVSSTASSLRPPGRWTDGVVALYGALDGEIGLHTFRSMMLSLFAGVEALVPVVPLTPFTLLPAPTMGLRVTWGRL